jgi:hypothetical protein
MIDDRELPSFHGQLIGKVIEYWGTQVLFEQNDSVIREKLSKILKSKINIETKVNWDMSPGLIDKGMAVGDISYLDENGIARVMTFTITATEAKAREYEEKN